MPSVIQCTNTDAVVVVLSDTELAIRDDLLFESSLCKRVESDVQHQTASASLVECKRLWKAAEASRVAIKEKPLEICRTIDALAKNYQEPLKAEEVRLARMVGTYEQQKREIAAQAERERQAEAAKLEQERQKQLQEARKTEDESKRAELIAKAEATKAQQQAVLQVPAVSAPRAAGVTSKPRNAYELIDIHALYRSNPELVDLCDKAGLIGNKINSGENCDSIKGIRIFPTVKVSVRG